jgi:hypothetical protein
VAPQAGVRATAALRAGTREALVSELAAQARMRAGFPDAREVMLDLAPFHDCCARLGLDPVDVFDEVAASGPADLADLLRRFGRRTDVTLNVFGWRLEDGPTYRFVLM